VADHARDRLGDDDRQVQHDADQVAFVAEIGRAVVMVVTMVMAVAMMVMIMVVIMIVVIVIVVVMVMIVVIMLMVVVVVPVIVSVVSHQAGPYSDAASGETGAWPW
jgi:hypothetical protein